MNSFIQPRQLELPDGFSLFVTPDIERIVQGNRVRFTLVYESRMAYDVMPSVGLIREPSPRSAIVIRPGEEPTHASVYSGDFMSCLGATRLARIEYVLDASGRFLFAVWPFGREIFTQLVELYAAFPADIPATKQPTNQLLNTSELPLSRKLCKCDQLGMPYGLDCCPVHPLGTKKTGCLDYADLTGPPHPGELQ
jgi:hypothetical protein